MSVTLKDLLFGSLQVPDAPPTRTHSMDGSPLGNPIYRRADGVRAQIRNALQKLGWAHHKAVAEATGLDNVVCRRTLGEMRRKQLVKARKAKTEKGGWGYEYRLPITVGSE